VVVSIGVQLETTLKIALETVQKALGEAVFVDVVTNMSIYLQKYLFHSPFSGTKSA